MNHTLVKYIGKGSELQYITNNCNFYGREFMVDKSVFIPRPETEKLIDIALEKIKLISSPSILDVGTGSGCIAITLALEKKKSNIGAEKDRGKEDNRDETRGTRREEYHVHIRLL